MRWCHGIGSMSWPGVRRQPNSADWKMFDSIGSILSLWPHSQQPAGDFAHYLKPIRWQWMAFDCRVTGLQVFGAVFEGLNYLLNDEDHHKFDDGQFGRSNLFVKCYVDVAADLDRNMWSLVHFWLKWQNDGNDIDIFIFLKNLLVNFFSF